MPEISLESYLDKSEELIDAAEFTKNIRLWRKATKEYPEEAEAWYRLGLACFQKLEEEISHSEIWEDDAELIGLYEEGAGALDEAVSIDQGHMDAWNVLGAMYALRDNLKGAVECWEKSLEINPDQDQVKSDLKELRKELE